MWIELRWREPRVPFRVVGFLSIHYLTLEHLSFFRSQTENADLLSVSTRVHASSFGQLCLFVSDVIARYHSHYTRSHSLVQPYAAAACIL
jgi:hypothetical protein